ncbi:MAG: hypothetical protein ACOYIB_07165, partial [Desulfosporosinus sp.]
MFKRKISTILLGLVVFTSLFLNGCSEKPFLTQDASYVIISISPSGMTQSEPIELPWNTNTAILQKLLLESSFVLCDLHTISAPNSSIKVPLQTSILQANYDEPKRMTFMIDREVLTLDVQSIQIQVEGANVGQVILNQTYTLQGINNPNLQPVFKDLQDTLHN